MQPFLNILVIDDDEINLMLISSLLKNHKDKRAIFHVKNGLDGFVLLHEKSNINLILLDLAMPIMNGLEFLSNIKEEPQLKNIPVIVMTTDETKQDEAYKRGAFSFIEKPIRYEQLCEKIDKVVKYLSTR